MIMYGQEIGTGASLSFDHYELNFGKSIPHFKRYNSMQPQWTAWGSNSLGVQNLMPAYSGVGLAREFSPALRSSNRWFLNPINTETADASIFAVAKYETANASPASSDVVLAFVNVSRSNNVTNTFGIPSGLASLLGLESGKLYNVKNIAAYLGPNNEYPNRRNTFLWNTPRSGGDILTNGVYVALNGVPTTDAGWATNPHEAQYLKVYAAPVITTGSAPGALSGTYGSPSTNGTVTFSAANVHDGLTITAPAGFQVSTNSSSGFASSLSLSNTGTIGNTTLYVRLAQTNVGSYSGNLTFSSPGGNNATVALASSSVGKATPTITTNPVAAAITYGQALSAATLTGGASSVPGTFAFTSAGTTPNATLATNFSVTFTPTDTANYNAVYLEVSVTVNPKGLTGSFVAANKTYDGTTSATVNSRSLDGVVEPDVVSLTGGTAAFSDANVGTSKTVTLTGASLTGAASGNYTLSSVSTTTANITAKAITGSFTAASKTYDGTTAATVVSRAVTGQVGSDDVNHTGGTATFDTAGVGTGKTVTLTEVSLTGTAAANYNLTSVSTTTANITAASVSSGDITLTRSGDSFSASASGVSGFTYSYAGRTANGIATSYGPSATAPTAAGYYTVTATSSDANYSGAKSENYHVTGPIAVADSLVIPTGNSTFGIPQASLLVNDVQIANNGSAITSSPNLTLASVLSVSGTNNVSTNGVMVNYTAVPGLTNQLFQYVIRDNVANKLATNNVTLGTQTSLAPFAISSTTRGTPEFDGFMTTITMTFVGDPKQTYYVYYKGSLTNAVWKLVGGFYSTNSVYTVDISEEGDHSEDWGKDMFFQGVK